MRGIKEKRVFVISGELAAQLKRTSTKYGIPETKIIANGIKLVDLALEAKHKKSKKQ